MALGLQLCSSVFAIDVRASYFLACVLLHFSGKMLSCGRVGQVCLDGR